jgi:hypothetical protein
VCFSFLDAQPESIIGDDKQNVGSICRICWAYVKREANQCAESLSEKCVFHFWMPSQKASSATISKMLGLFAATEGLMEDVRQNIAQMAVKTPLVFPSKNSPIKAACLP